MKKFFHRALSLILAAALLCSPLCLFSVLAEQKMEAVILYEDESKRTANEKHYYCSDGSYLAVSYSQAVHYPDEAGRYQDIDNSLTYNEKSASYENPGNPDFALALSDKNGSDTVKVKGRGGEEISFSTALLIKGQSVEAKPKKKNINAFNNSQKNAKGKRIGDEGAFDLPLVGAVLEYREYYGSASVTGRYTVTGNSLKEDLLLNAPSNITGFITTYKAKNLILTVNDDGSLLFKDESGVEQYRVQAPFMYDAAGSVCPKIEVSVKEQGNKYQVSYLPDSTWLSSDERVYPLTFDPTLSATKTYISYDVYYETTNGTVVEYDNNHLSCSYATLTATNRTFTRLYLNSYPTINLHQYEIVSAELSLKVMTAMGSTPFLYRLNESFYNGSYSMTDYVPAQVDYITTGIFADGYCTFDVSSDARAVISGEKQHTGYILYESQMYGNGLYYASPHADGPSLTLTYRAKDFEGKYVLKNGSGYLLSENTSDLAATPAVDTRGLKVAESFEIGDFYYCEWIFERELSNNSYKIVPAYDQSFCLQEVSGEVKLTPIAEATTGQYWYFEVSADGATCTIINETSNKKLYLTESAVALSAAGALSDSYNFTVTRTYQGVYTFKNVGQNLYLYTNNGLTYENTNIVLADMSQISSHKVDPFAFRVVYDAIDNGYRIMPISSSNGTYRRVTVNKTVSSGSHVVKMKLPASEVYSIFNITTTEDSAGTTLYTFTAKDAPTLALTGSSTVVTSPTQDNGYVTTTDVVATTYSVSNTSQQWILEAYKHTVHTTADYTEVEKYYSSLDFASPFGVDGRSIELTSDFGNRIRSSGVNTHEGVDLRTLGSIDLYAPCGGRVASVNTTVTNTNSAGKYVVIETDCYSYGNDQKLYIVYMHMDSIVVSVNQTVNASTKLGQSGKTGEGVKSHHLHYGVFVAPQNITSSFSNYWNGTPVNPLFFYEPVTHRMSCVQTTPQLTQYEPIPE